LEIGSKSQISDFQFKEPYQTQDKSLMRFLSGVLETDENFFSGIKDTGTNFLAVSLTPAQNF